MHRKRLFFVLLAALVLTLTARAASEAQILQQRLDPNTNQWTLYVRHPGGAAVDGVRLGGVDVEDAVISKNAGATSLVTWILFDNSASMPEEARDKVSDLLLTLLGEKGRGELHTFCTFSDRLRVQLRDSGSFTELKQQIDALEYVDRKSNLMGALSTALTEEAAQPGTAFVRIIVISMGGDAVPSGRDTRSLWKRLEDNNIPIYTIGCQTESNADALSWMYALSTRTHARAWDMNKVGAADIANIMHWEEIPVRVSLTVPDNLRGGDLEMTFSDGTSVRTANPLPELEALPESAPDTGGVSMWWGILLAAVLLGVGCAVMLRRYAGRKKTVTPSETTPPIPVRGSRTLCLTDAEHPERAFSVPLQGRVTVGRGEDNQIVLDYDQSISRTHCELYPQDNTLWVQDSNSSGGTYVNEARVTNARTIPQGAILRLGHVRYNIEVR